MLVFHFSRFILLIAHFSCRGMQNAACTTAVAPTPEIQYYNTVSKFLGIDVQIEQMYVRTIMTLLYVIACHVTLL